MDAVQVKGFKVKSAVVLLPMQGVDLAIPCKNTVLFLRATAPVLLRKRRRVV
jgi:hypothetical protein